MLKKLLFGLLSLLLIVVLLAAYVQFSYNRNFDEEYPVAEMTIKADSAMISHGRYLAFGPAHCASCHVSMEDFARVEAGEELPMRGGMSFKLPIGTLYAANLTPDATGIGNISDGQLYRMMRHNINYNGEAAGPELMPFRNMSEYDIKSVIAFLRTQPAIENEVPEREESFVWKVLQRFMFEPLNPDGEPLQKIVRDSSILYGEYLAANVANCRGCHTARDMATGAFTGPEYAGGMVFEPSPETKGWRFVTPNLTKDPATGVMANWTEEQFINRFRMGRTKPGSPMPWASFARMSDSDLKAIYRFLQTIEPVENTESGQSTPPAQQAAL